MEDIKFTPLAGRTAPAAKDAVTGSVFIVIIINIVILLFVELAIVAMLDAVPALFWTFIAVLIAADAALCPLIFRLALHEVRENSSAPPYTVAVHGEELVLIHTDGSEERFGADRVVEVKARPARFGFMLIGWASAGKPAYGKLIFSLKGEGGKRRKVKYVAGSERAAEFIRRAIIRQGR